MAGLFGFGKKRNPNVKTPTSGATKLFPVASSPELTESDKSMVHRLWVNKIVSFSSQYDANSWPAICVIGPPKVYPRYGDIPGAWAPLTCDANQFLEIQFEKSLYIKEINIYETYHAGGVKKIDVMNDTSNPSSWVTVYRNKKVQNIQQSRIFTPEIEKVNFRTDKLKLYIDCSVSNTWVEIDAVEIVGKEFSIDVPIPENTLVADLYKLVANQKYSDIKFIVGGEEIHAHKAILMVRSEYFRALFEHDAKKLEEKPVVQYEDLNAQAFKIILEYIYTNEFQGNAEPVLLVEVWRMADMFSMDNLQALVLFWITESLNLDNVVDVYLESINKIPSIDTLKTICTEYMSANVKKVVRTKAFEQLPHEVMLELVQMMTDGLKL